MSRAALIAAARAWHLSKRPPAWSAAEHARHPWVCVFGKEATQLAVACADGPDDCIIAAALAWYRAGMNPDPAFIDSVDLKEVIEQYLSNSSDIKSEENVIMQIMCDYAKYDCHGVMQYTPSEETGNGKVAVELHHLKCPDCGRDVKIEDFGRMDGLGKNKGKRQSTVRVSAPISQESEMNLWQVSLPGKCRRFVASQADGREMRELFLQEYGVKKKDVIVEPVSVPTKKEDLIAYLNEAYASIDAAGVQS